MRSAEKIGRSMRVFGVRPYQPSARRVYQPAAFRHRRDCHAEAGSFFDVVPSGADAHLLKHVIHDWHDARAAAVGPRCARRPGCWIVEGSRSERERQPA